MADRLRQLYHRYDWCEYFQLKKIEFSGTVTLPTFTFSKHNNIHRVGVARLSPSPITVRWRYPLRLVWHQMTTASGRSARTYTDLASLADRTRTAITSH